MVTLIFSFIIVAISLKWYSYNDKNYFIKYSFIHINCEHLIINLLCFIIFGCVVENEIGVINYITIIVLSIFIPIIPYYKAQNVFGFSGVVAAIEMLFIFNFNNHFFNYVPYIYCIYCFIAYFFIHDKIAHLLHAISVSIAIIFNNLIL